ncbi:hypothetical protein LCGC14_0380610 [marine sediment metagenome]|uniref:Uncharacterized protein n=1 Tax=marine sediment metagenome TaxID=412755 RepID=A0A0F9T297_9ZZZZ
MVSKDVIRSGRLNSLLRIYLARGNQAEIFSEAKRMGVADATAWDYTRTVIIKATKMRK